MNYRRIAMAVTGLATSAALASASAQAPAECNTGPGLQSYQAAYRTHARFLETLFRTSYGCRSLEAFSDKVAELTLGLSTSDPCRAAGNREAASDTIDNVTQECLGGASPVAEAVDASSGLRAVSAPEGECARNGREEGTLRAELYCAPGCPGPGPCVREPPVPLCDLVAAQYCKQAFRRHVNLDEACTVKALGDPSYNEVVEAACAPPD